MIKISSKKNIRKTCFLKKLKNKIKTKNYGTVKKLEKIPIV